MNTGNLFVESFYDALQQKGIGYCILRNADEIRLGDAHDIDMTVDAARLEEAGECLFTCAQKLNWHLHFAAGSFRDPYHFKPLHFYHIGENGTVSIVHFDICPTFAWDGYVIVSNDTLLRDIDASDCYHTVHPSAEAVIDFFIRLLYNGYIKDKYKERIHDFFRDYPQQVRQNLEEIISEEHAETLMYHVSARNWEAAAAMRSVFIRDIKKKAVTYRRSLVWHKLRKLWYYPGVMVAVEGCDGSGKSTLIEGLRPILRNTFTEDCFHCRRGPGTADCEKAAEGLPALLMLMQRAAKDILNYWIGFRRKLGAGHLIAYERYNGASYLHRQRLARVWGCLIRRFVPQADITLVLLCKSAATHLQQEQNARLKNAMHSRENAVMLDADQAPEQLINKAAAAILKTMAARYRA